MWPPKPASDSHQDRNFLILIAIFYLILYGFRLWQPGNMYFDEVYQVSTAQEILHLEGYTETSHPPLGMLAIAGSIFIFGNHPWAWRLVSLFSGLGSLILIFLISKKLFQNQRAARFSLFLFMFDGLPFTQARIGIHNAQMLFLILLSIFCLMNCDLASKKNRRLSLFLSGFFWGLALCTKWVSMGALVPLVLVYKKLWEDNEKKHLAGKRTLIKESILFLTLLPIVFYFIPFMVIPFIKGLSWQTIWVYQVLMATYHSHLKVGHEYGSTWWSWPLLLRPIQYFYETRLSAFLLKRETISTILCIGNPSIFWTLPAVFLFSIWKSITEKLWPVRFALISSLAFWLPWSLISRVKFFHYFYVSFAFLVILLGWILDQIWTSGKNGKILVGIYLLLIVGLFIYWYPLYTAIPITKEIFESHLWFKSWA